MRQIVFSLLLGAVAFAGELCASEQIYVNAAFFYSNETMKYEDYKSDTSRLYSHLGFGVHMASGLLLGAKYVQLDDDLKEDDDKWDNSMTAYGLSLGYMHTSGFGVMGTYLLEPERESVINGSKSVWSGGDGSVIDVGYYFTSGGVAIGPQISMVKASYEKHTIDGTENEEFDGPYEESFTYPYVGIFVYF